MRRLHEKLVVSLAFPLLVTGCAEAESAPAPSIAPVLLPVPRAENTTLLVQQVVDGRTVVLTGGTRVRIEGLAEPGECWAAAARSFARALLLDKPVRVNPEADTSPLFLADDTEYALVAVGQGVLRGDARHDPAYREAETAAAEEKLGLWGPPCNGRASVR